MAGFTLVFHASGTKPKNLISAVPSAGPQSSPGLPPFGHGMASPGFLSLSTENIGINTYRCAVCLMLPPVGSAVGSVTAWQIGVCISFGSDCAGILLKSRSIVG